MEIEFRRATVNDVPAIVDLCNECFDENTSVHDAKKIMIDTKKDKNQIYLIGLMNKQVIAHGKMNIYCILNHVCVKEEYRRNNIATKMLIECEKIARENGCVSMKLWSSNFRHAAHECYKRYGFKIHDAAFFTKELR